MMPVVYGIWLLVLGLFSVNCEPRNGNGLECYHGQMQSLGINAAIYVRVSSLPNAMDIRLISNSRSQASRHSGQYDIKTCGLFYDFDRGEKQWTKKTSPYGILGLFRDFGISRLIFQSPKDRHVIFLTVFAPWLTQKAASIPISKVWNSEVQDPFDACSFQCKKRQEASYIPSKSTLYNFENRKTDYVVLAESSEF